MQEVRKVKNFLASSFTEKTLSLSFSGSSFLPSLYKDSSFQHGGFLGLQLGSKNAKIQVPFFIGSLQVSEGSRSISMTSRQSSSFNNYVAFVKNAAP